MDFKDLVKMRYSVRKYEDKEVKRETLEAFLEVVRNAPSASNRQPWHFIVLTKEDVKNKVCETYKLDWITKAPVIIVACGDHSESWKRDDGKDHCDIDVSIAIDHLTLAAVEKGLGTCWVCAFDAKKVSEVLELPSHLEPIALIPIGYPLDKDVRAKKRKDFEEITSWR